MHVEKHLTTVELSNAIRREKIAKLATRMRGVLAALNGRTHKEAAADLGVSPRSIQEWVRRYNQGGLEALREKPRPGRPKRLSEDQEREVAAWLEAGPDLDTDGVTAWRGRVVAEKIGDHFGTKLSLSGAYKIMHRLGYEPLRPRPFHPKSDEKAQAAFTAAAPLFSRRSGATTPARSSKSGSRTR